MTRGRTTGYAVDVNLEDIISWFARSRRARLSLTRPYRRQSHGPQRRPGPPPIERMDVQPHDRGWALVIDDVGEPAWVVSTKKKALIAAKACARYHDAALFVHTRTGRVSEVSV